MDGYSSIKRWLMFGGVSGLIVLVFYPVLDSYFVTDDMRLIYISTPLTVDSILEYFTSSGGFFSGYYRPFVRLSLLMDYSLYQLNPMGFHVTNLLLHIAITILVFYIAWNVTGNETAGWIAAFIFAVQPLHTEAVSWITGRNDLIFTLFYLMAFLSFFKYISMERLKRRFLVLSCFFFVLSLLSKETAITLPVILFLADFFLNRKKSGDTHRGKQLATYLPFAVVTAGYVILKVLVIKGRFYYSEIGITTLLRTGYSFLQLFAPINIDTFSFGNLPGFILNSIIMLNIAVLLCAYLYYCKDKNRPLPVFVFGASWIFITAFPLYFGSGARFLYIASVASSMLMGLVLVETTQGMKKQNSLFSKALVLILVFSIVSTSSIRILHRNVIYNYAGEIANGILTQINNKYPHFPKGSVLYFFNFPQDWIRDTEVWVKAIPVMGMAIRVKYSDTSLIVHSRMKKAVTFEEKLRILEQKSMGTLLREGKPCYVFEYQDGTVIETTDIFSSALTL